MADTGLNYLDSKNYVNRELSWLEFDFRILNEARDKSIPLFERLKFLSITASNLDEFFMVRVASLKDMVHAKYKKTDIAGLRPEEQLELIGEKTHELVALQYSTYNRSLLPALKQQGLQIVSEHEELTEKDGNFVDRFFHDNVYPVLTPMAVDSSRSNQVSDMTFPKVNRGQPTGSNTVWAKRCATMSIGPVAVIR